MTSEFANRLRFHEDLQAMEADFSDFHFADSLVVNSVYDTIEAAIANSGHKLWFFLVNLHGMKIEQSAWPDYAKRGKALNLAHSMGTVRFDASSETSRRINSAAQSEQFDPNLLSNRADAIERLRKLPSRRADAAATCSNHPKHEWAARITLDPDNGILEADLSNLTLYHAQDVNDLYDHISETIQNSERDQWYFLVNYENCTIEPAAWVQFAHRGKQLNTGHSLGSVRYAPGSETEDDIRMRAKSQDFRPNIRNTREDALNCIAELKALSKHA